MSTWQVGKVDDVVKIVPASHRLKMTLPGIEVLIFIKRFVVQNAVPDPVPNIANGRANSGGRSSGKRHRNLGKPGLECILFFGEVEPVCSSWRSKVLLKP